jgi:hypothetical protein
MAKAFARKPTGGARNTCDRRLFRRRVVGQAVAVEIGLIVDRISSGEPRRLYPLYYANVLDRLALRALRRESSGRGAEFVSGVDRVAVRACNNRARLRRLSPLLLPKGFPCCPCKGTPIWSNLNQTSRKMHSAAAFFRKQ